MQRMLVCLFACLLAIDLPAHEKAVAHAESLIKALQEFQTGMADASAEVRRKTLADLLPSREDVATLFPEHADLFWNQLDAHNQNLLQHSDNVAREWATGKEIRFEAIDLRRNDEARTHEAVFKIIPQDIPVFRVVRRSGRRASGSGSYLFIKGRWIHLQGLEMIPNIIVHSRK